MIGVINLNMTMDRVYYLPGFRPGRVYRAAAAVQAGGKGVNAAGVLRSLGERCLLTGCTGGSIGRWVEKDLARRKIPFVPLVIGGETRVTSIIRDGRSGRHTVINEPGPEPGIMGTKRLAAHLKRFIDTADAALFCGSVPRGVAPRDYAAAVRSAVGRKIPVLVDIGGKHLKAALAACPDTVKVNREEWEGMLGRKLKDSGELRAAVLPYLKKGVRRIIVTEGAKGMSWFCGGRAWKIAAPEVRAVNTVGCGDALGAAVMTGVRRMWPEEKIMRFGAAVAAAQALSPLPGTLRKIDIDGLAARIRITGEKQLRWKR